MFEHVAPWLEALTIIVLGIFSFLTLLERRTKTRQNETITNFEKTIESMKARMAEMDIELKDGRKAHQDSLEKIAHLRGENETLKSLLLGKDPQSVQYKEQTIALLQEMVRELKQHDSYVRRVHPENG
jgi:hypothetical protein